MDRLNHGSFTQQNLIDQLDELVLRDSNNACIAEHPEPGRGVEVDGFMICAIIDSSDATNIT
jgi:hypothetical protein